MSDTPRTLPQSPQAVLDAFAANFFTMDAGAQASLFRPDATFLGSSVPGMLRGPEGALSYFLEGWAKASPGVMTCDLVTFQTPAPDVVIFSTLCRLVRPEGAKLLRANGTMIHDPEGWRFADLHVSVAPPAR